MPRNLSVPRTKTEQPNFKDTRKGQKHFQIPPSYDPQPINQEFDYIHERINQIAVEAEALTDLSGSATLAQVITRVNALTEILREAGLLRRE